MAFHLSQEEYPLELPSGREYLVSLYALNKQILDTIEYIVFLCSS